MNISNAKISNSTKNTVMSIFRAQKQKQLPKYFGGNDAFARASAISYRFSQSG